MVAYGWLVRLPAAFPHQAMRAARMLERNGTPVLEDVPEIDVPKGACRIEGLAAGLQRGDLMRAQGIYKVPELPYTIGGEGVGRLPDGRRVYFGHSIPESGAVCEFTVVPEEEVWPIPDEFDDSTAIAVGAGKIPRENDAWLNNPSSAWVARQLGLDPVVIGPDFGVFTAALFKRH